MLLKKVLAALVAAVMIFSLGVPTALAATGDDDGVTVTITPGETGAETQSPEAPEAEANDTEDAEDEEAGAEESEDPDKLLTPDSPFYFLKRFVESVKLFLTFDQEKKVNLLAELAEERAKELEALQQKFADGELTEAQFKLLEKALEDLVLSTERLVDALVPEEAADEDETESNNDDVEDEETDEADDTDEPEETDEADESNPNDEDAQDEDELDETDEEDDDEKDTDTCGDKYLRRIAHLQSIADKAPQAAQKGLARAIDNAWRQRERAIAKGKIVVTPETDPDEESEVAEENLAPSTQEVKTTKDCTSLEKKDKDDKPKFTEKEKEKQNKAKGNNGRGPIKTSPGKGKGKNKGK